MREFNRQAGENAKKIFILKYWVPDDRAILDFAL